MKKYLLATLALGLFAAVACKRESREFAQKNTPSGSPTYQVAAKESAGHLPDRIVEVFPTGKLDGQALYLKNCSACHQVTGQGIPGAFPPLDNSLYVTSDNVDRLAAIMIYGLMGPIHVNGQLYNNVMAPLGGALNDEEFAAISTYIRGAWSNKAGPVGPEVFAAQRAKWGTRSMFQIAELGEEK